VSDGPYLQLVSLLHLFYVSLSLSVCRAPEMLAVDENGKRVHYGLSVDWFSFGCLLYEFLAGVSPFLTEVATNWGGLGLSNEARAIDLAIKEMDPFFDPEIFDPLAKDICSKLLCKDGSTRLGAHGAGEVMAHAFFDDIDWVDMEREVVRPPFIPRREVNSMAQDRIGTFDLSENVAKVELTRADLDFFSKWDFVRPECFFEEAVMHLQANERYVSSDCSLLAPSQLFF
jgi:serine/threonine protein kinase